MVQYITVQLWKDTWWNCVLTGSWCLYDYYAPTKPINPVADSVHLSSHCLIGNFYFAIRDSFQFMAKASNIIKTSLPAPCH